MLPSKKVAVIPSSFRIWKEPGQALAAPAGFKVSAAWKGRPGNK